MLKTFRPAIVLVTALLVVAGATVWAQAIDDEPVRMSPLEVESLGEFQFARLAYSANQYGRGRGRGWGGRQMWQTDWPDAEYHFLRGVDRLTRIEAAEQGHVAAERELAEDAQWKRIQQVSSYFYQFTAYLSGTFTQYV